MHWAQGFLALVGWLQGPQCLSSLQPELESTGVPEGQAPKQDPEGTAKITAWATGAALGHFFGMQRMFVLLGLPRPRRVREDRENSLCYRRAHVRRPHLLWGRAQ